MGGEHGNTRIGRWLRVLASPLTVSAALVVAGGVAVSGAAAQDIPAATKYAVGTPGMLVAQEIARATWATDPCGGQVTVEWGADEANINARSYWANPRSAYDNPEQNVQCRIVFNAGMAYSWPKFCTVLVHEYGHLAGRAHVADGPDVMSPIYRAPLAACQGEEPGVAPAAPAPAAPVVTAPPVVEVDVAPVTRPRKQRTRARVTGRSQAKTARAQKMQAKPKARAAGVLQTFGTTSHLDGCSCAACTGG